MLTDMLVLATNKHAGQYDRGGKPYILHPLRVMYTLKCDDEELQCIAIGHDLLEDTDVTAEELDRLGFSKRVVDGIVALTKVPNETQKQVMTRICSNVDAMRVKLCDLRHNSDIRRLKGVTDKDIKRIIKYNKMYAEISDKLKVLDSPEEIQQLVTNSYKKAIGIEFEKIWTHGCGACDFDEASGEVVNHCKGCCTKIVNLTNEMGTHFNSMVPYVFSYEDEQAAIKVIEKRSGLKFKNR